MRILIVEDEPELNRLLKKRLEQAHYSVDACLSGTDALDYLGGAEYDAVVLDVMLPGISGLEVLRRMRAGHNATPVLLLTARGGIEDRVTGLDAGADDYLVKPFDFDELLARIRAMTRKHAGLRTNRFTAGDLVMDVAQRRVTRGGAEIPLLPKEFSILEYLLRNKEQVLSREQIENRIWNYEYSGSSNNVDGYMSRLRKKIDEGRDQKLIHTVKGMGWVIREPEDRGETP